MASLNTWIGTVLYTSLRLRLTFCCLFLIPLLVFSEPPAGSVNRCSVDRVVVVGISSGQHERQVILENLETKEQDSFKEGQVTSYGLLIESITNRSVTLACNDRRIVLNLQGGREGEAKDSPGESSIKGFSKFMEGGELVASIPDYAWRNMAEQFSEVKAQSLTLGVLLTEVSEGSLFGFYGLKNRDILFRVNNIMVTSAEQALVQIKSSKEFARIEVLRGKERIILNLYIPKEF